MKTFGKTLSFDSNFAHSYRPLVRNLILIIIATLVLAAVAVVFFDQRLVGSLSESLIEKSSQANNEKLHRLFDTAAKGLGIAQQQIEALEIGSDERELRLFNALEPFLAELELLDSINVAESSGGEYVLIKQPGEVLTRRVDASSPDIAHWKRRIGGDVAEEWTRQIEVSPKDRPWYQGAIKRARGARHWTTPYAFLTTKEPGISVSSRWPSAGGSEEHVMAFNITLIEISRHTTRVRPSEHGMTVIFNQDGKTIGLPPGAGFDDDQALLAAVLSSVTGFKIPALDSALDTWEHVGRSEGIFPFRAADQSAWWAGFSATELDEGYTIWSTVLIPEEDFLGSTAQMRNFSLAGIGIAGLLIAAIVFFTSMKSIRGRMREAVDRVERRLGQYHLTQKIGEGGNGAVYRARHALLRRPTAVKLMNPEFALSDAARERFEHEVQITSNLSHPNTIAIYDYGCCPDRTLYYAMELLNGATLEQLVGFSGALPAGRVIHIMEQIAGSLAEAHDKHLIHRDVKPSNAILCERGGLFDVVKVVDFGLVKEISETDGNLTQANVLIGTPLYMAPEIIRQPGQAGAQSDLYALGAVGYFLLSARNVFEGGSAVEICAKHLNDPPVPPSQRGGPAVPSDLEAVILACLEKDPARRPASAASLRASLLRCDAAGAWSQEDAREWWQTHSAAFIGAASPGESLPLSNTEFLIDLDDRMVSSGIKVAGRH